MIPKTLLFFCLLWIVPSTVQGNLVDNGNGTVTDTGTGLIWQQDGSGSVMAWEAALVYCENLELGGYDDWRLPSKNELRSLVDYQRYAPVLDTAFFPDTALSNYWTSTTAVFKNRYAWCINFNDGISNPSGKGVSRHVRAVRGTTDSRVSPAAREVRRTPDRLPADISVSANEPPQNPSRLSSATPSGTENGACQVLSLETIGPGAFPSFSPDGTLIAFTLEVDVNDYQIFTMSPDATEMICLTCDQPELSGTRWRGQPFWHPSGDFLVFTAETAAYPRSLIGTATRPGVGRNHDVWLMTRDGRRFWRLTQIPDNGGIIRPRFSRNGGLLFWNEEYSLGKYPVGRWFDLKIPDDPPEVIGHPGAYWDHLGFVYRKGEELGAWRVRISTVSFNDGDLHLSPVSVLEPPDGYTLIEAAGFTPLDDGIIASYAPLTEHRGQGFWGDIFVTDLGGTFQQRLTSTPFVHDENPEFSPDGLKILWSVSSQGEPGAGEELYLMSADGSSIQRLTYFTDPDQPEYDPIARQITEITWSPDGAQTVFGQVSQEERGGPHLPSNLYLLTFSGPCGLTPPSDTGNP